MSYRQSFVGEDRIQTDSLACGINEKEELDMKYEDHKPITHIYMASSKALSFGEMEDTILNTQCCLNSRNSHRFDNTGIIPLKLTSIYVY